MECYNNYSKTLHEKASEIAKKCNSLVFMGGLYPTEKGLRNTTVVYNRDGKIAGKYYKQHLVPKEMGFYGLDCEYTYESESPYIIELDGVKYGFLICYDAYFYEMYSYISKFNPDIIVACSHQRSDSHHILETMNEFLAYNTNAYVLRASVSMGEDSSKGGSSMIVSPEGIVLANAKSKIGNIVEFIYNPKQ